MFVTSLYFHFNLDLQPLWNITPFRKILNVLVHIFCCIELGSIKYLHHIYMYSQFKGLIKERMQRLLDDLCFLEVSLRKDVVRLKVHYHVRITQTWESKHQKPLNCQHLQWTCKNFRQLNEGNLSIMNLTILSTIKHQLHHLHGM